MVLNHLDFGNPDDDLCLTMQNLAETVRHKAFRKRVLTKDLRWSFGNNFEIAVALYGMLRTAVKGTYTWLNAQNNAPLRAETAYICNDTGATSVCSFLPGVSYNR